MASPTFDRALHDVGIGGKGYMTPLGGRVVRQDAVPATARAALGESTYDLFQEPAFYAQGTFSGGAGQGRLLSTDSYLSGVCDSRWQGAVFPARKLQTAASSGGTTAFMFHRDATVYGFVGSNIEQFGSSTTFGSSVVPRHQPIVDGNNHAFWVSSTNKVMKWTGTGTPTDLTTPIQSVGRGSVSASGGFTPYVVADYNRYIWALGTRRVESTPTVVQHATTAGSANLHIYRFKYRPVSGNLLILTVTLGSTMTVETVSAGWALAESNTTDGDVRTYLYYKVAEPNERLAGEVTVSGPVVLTVSEWEGMDAAGILDAHNGASAAATTSVAPGSITTTEADTLVLTLTASTAATAIAAPSGYTELVEEAHELGYRTSLSFKVLTATATENPTVSATGSGDLSSLIVAFKGNTITTDTEAFSILYSADGGASWVLAFTDVGTGIEAPTAAVAAGGFLWFTTPRGLYQLGVEDTEFADGHTTLSIFIRGKLDTFARPSGTPATGRTPDNFTAGHLVYWEGALYYPMGQTLRSFPIGGQSGRQVWPTADWSTAGGDLKAVVAGEGGIYFAAGNILWNYNGRGFHPLATNATSGIYDYLYWHDGKLYVKADPAQYYDFGYPSLRPDIYDTTATNFETGYVITSLIDFEKADVFKHISAFQSFATFSAVADSGTITWAYRSADTGIAPDRYGGGATALTWTTLGTHTVTDGNVKDIDITTIKAKAIWLRATIAPGASGYPIVKVPVAVGRAIMPTLKRFVCDIGLATGMRDKSGALLYASTTAVYDAVAELNALRDGTDTFTLTYVEMDGGTTEYTCTADQMQDSATDFKKTTVGVEGQLQFVAIQLPRLTPTETAPGGGAR